jgi:hypothetical protein
MAFAGMAELYRTFPRSWSRTGDASVEQRQLRCIEQTGSEWDQSGIFGAGAAAGRGEIVKLQNESKEI